MVSLVSNARWTDASLDQLRFIGDLPADTAIEIWKEDARNGPVGRLAQRLVGFERAKEIDQLVDLLSKRNGMAARINPALRRAECGCTDAELAAGHRLFREYGLKILMILVFYSLPSAYAAQNGVQVLHLRNGGTGFFVKNMNRRLVETTQFVIDVMTPGGLRIDPGQSADHGAAVRSALRVRLLHAAVRALIEAHRPPWDVGALGKPVNQEDMAGTLLTFSWLVLDGLRTMGIQIDRQTQEDYFGIWKKVGALLGVNDELIPANVDQAGVLMARIKARQIDIPIRRGTPNTDGIEMTKSLVDFTTKALPPLIRWRALPESVMRVFLPTEVATSLGIPRRPILRRIVKLWFFIEARVTKFKFYDHINRAIFKEWGSHDRRVRSFLQFSRFFNKRLVHHIQCFDRNEPLEERHRLANITLKGWDKEWAFDQADFVSRRVKRLRRTRDERRRGSGK